MLCEKCQKEGEWKGYTKIDINLNTVKRQILCLDCAKEIHGI